MANDTEQGVGIGFVKVGMTVGLSVDGGVTGMVALRGVLHDGKEAREATAFSTMGSISGSATEPIQAAKSKLKRREACSV